MLFHLCFLFLVSTACPGRPPKTAGRLTVTKGIASRKAQSGKFMACYKKKILSKKVCWYRYKYKIGTLIETETETETTDYRSAY